MLCHSFISEEEKILYNALISVFVVSHVVVPGSQGLLLHSLISEE